MLWKRTNLNMLAMKLDVSAVAFCGVTLVLLLATTVECKRYRYCSQGCCPNEFCAFHTICYPKMHCSNGCPDGTCQKEAKICFPHKPCKRNYECSFAHSCTRNYNLGYDTCQYNLEIGTTLCEDRDGKSLLEPMS